MESGKQCDVGLELPRYLFVAGSAYFSPCLFVFRFSRVSLWTSKGRNVETLDDFSIGHAKHSGLLG